MPIMPTFGTASNSSSSSSSRFILGPGRLPDVGAALGKTIREFRKASLVVQDPAMSDTPPLPAYTASRRLAAPVAQTAADAGAGRSRRATTVDSPKFKGPGSAGRPWASKRTDAPASD